MNTISTNNLTKYYGKVKGIENLNLSVAEGDFFGFIGPNGAGKSTTIRTLLGLISPTGGSAAIFGLDIAKDKKSILKRCGYLPSETAFYSGMKVKDVIKLSADLRKACCEKEAKELCERLELDTNRKVSDLSLGNKKKVAIVCALQHKPDLIILDEPTSGLDPLMQKEFFDILREMNADGATVFLSGHILSEIQRYCKKAAIIKSGGIIACDSVENLSKTNAKRITIHGTFDMEKLGDVRDVQRSGDNVSFLYSGDISVLLQVLSCGKIENLSVTEPPLEEIFLHYYERSENA